MKLNTRLLSALIEHVYAAPLQPNGWSAALELFKAVFSLNVAVLYGQRPGGGRLTFFESIGSHSALLEEFSRYYIHIDPRITRTTQARTEMAVAEWTIMPTREWCSTEIYNDFARPYEVPYLLATNLILEANQRVILSLNRSETAGVFDTEELRFSERIFPHAANAVRLTQRLANSRQLARASLETLNRMPFSLITVDRLGRVLEATDNAQALFRCSDALRVDCGVLVAAQDTHTKAIHAAIAAVADSARLAESCPKCIEILRVPPATPLTVHVVPGGQRSWADEWGRVPAALVFVFEAGSTHDTMASIRRQYRLSDSEARLLKAFLRGVSLASAADELGISMHTARNMLKRILSKTGARSQVELMRNALIGATD